MAYLCMRSYCATLYRENERWRMSVFPHSLGYPRGSARGASYPVSLAFTRRARSALAAADIEQTLVDQSCGERMRKAVPSDHGRAREHTTKPINSGQKGGCEKVTVQGLCSRLST